jgi:ABC-type spermidine/putrescine transport system permease subunit I
MSGVSKSGARDHSGSPAKHGLVIPAGLLWLTCFVVPVGLLVIYSLGSTDLVTYKLHLGWTTGNYTAVFQSFYLKPILRSVELAVATTALCCIIGFPTAYYMSQSRGKLRAFLLLTIVVPYLTSFVIRAYAWLDLLSPSGPLSSALKALHITSGGLNILYSQTSIAIVLVYTYLPLMVIPTFVALDRLDPALLAAAADLGANGRRTLTRVILPLAKPGIYSGCLLVFVLALGEYTIPYVIGGGKTLMFGNIIADQFREVGDYSAGAALATSLTAVVVMSVVLLRRRSSEVVF